MKIYILFFLLATIAAFAHLAVLPGADQKSERLG
jgi:hypothetical protein